MTTTLLVPSLPEPYAETRQWGTSNFRAQTGQEYRLTKFDSAARPVRSVRYQSRASTDQEARELEARLHAAIEDSVYIPLRWSRATLDAEATVEGSAPNEYADVFCDLTGMEITIGELAVLVRDAATYDFYVGQVLSLDPAENGFVIAVTDNTVFPFAAGTEVMPLVEAFAQPGNELGYQRHNTLGLSADFEELVGEDFTYTLPDLTDTRTATFTPVADTHIRKFIPNGNYGQDEFALFGKTDPDANRRFIVQFDLSSLRNAYISSATVTLYGSGSDGIEMTAYRLTRRGWIEDGATWMTYDGVNKWDSYGGDYDMPSSPSTWPVGDDVEVETTVTAHTRDGVANRGGQVTLIFIANEDGDVDEVGTRHSDIPPVLEVTYGYQQYEDFPIFNFVPRNIARQTVMGKQALLGKPWQRRIREKIESTERLPRLELLQENNFERRLLRDFFDAMQGMAGKFWLRSYKADYSVAVAASGGASALVLLDHTGSAVAFDGIERHAYIPRIGQAIRLSAPSDSSGNMGFTIAPVLDAALVVGDVLENLFLVRFDSDSMTLSGTDIRADISRADLGFHEIQPETP